MKILKRVDICVFEEDEYLRFSSHEWYVRDFNYLIPLGEESRSRLEHFYQRRIIKTCKITGEIKNDG